MQPDATQPAAGIGRLALCDDFTTSSSFGRGGARCIHRRAGSRPADKPGQPACWLVRLARLLTIELLDESFSE
jgi:hypothetical protein